MTGQGTVNTIYRDDIGWQMLIVNDAPREFWQRTRKPAAPHWRNWRKFVDFRTVNDAIDAAVSTAIGQNWSSAAKINCHLQGAGATH